MNSGSSDNSRGIESGTDELKKKFKVEVEKLDSRGIFRRSRVVNQTRIDSLFLDRAIDIAQFSAAELYLELLWKAGIFLRSPSMERSFEVTGKEVEKSISSRILAISGARSKLRKLDPKVALAVDLCIGSNAPVDIGLLREGLDVLVDHFGISRMADPRKKTR